TRVRVYVICVAVFIAGLVGLSRIYLGVHWPSDVIAGWALGAAWASFLWLVITLMHPGGRRSSKENISSKHVYRVCVGQCGTSKSGRESNLLRVRAFEAME